MMYVLQLQNYAICLVKIMLIVRDFDFSNIQLCRNKKIPSLCRGYAHYYALIVSFFLSWRFGEILLWFVKQTTVLIF